MTLPKPRRGGRRPGAGRPPFPQAETPEDAAEQLARYADGEFVEAASEGAIVSVPAALVSVPAVRAIVRRLRAKGGKRPPKTPTGSS